MGGKIHGLNAGLPDSWASQEASGKEPPARDIGDEGSIPEWGRSPRGGHGTHSSILSWRIPWTEPGGLQSIRSQRVGHDRSNLDAHTLPDSRALTFKPILPNPALTSGQGLPEVGACLNWPRCPSVTRCRLQNGDRLGNFPARKELGTPVWGKAYIGFQHLPEYCRTAPPAHFTHLGMVAPHSL